MDGSNTLLASIENVVSRIAQHSCTTHSSVPPLASGSSVDQDIPDVSVDSTILDASLGNHHSGPRARRCERSAHRFIDVGGDEIFCGQSSAYAFFDCTKIRFERRANTKDDGNF